MNEPGMYKVGETVRLLGCRNNYGTIKQKDLIVPENGGSVRVIYLVMWENWTKGEGPIGWYHESQLY